jgi:hypothetical protein
LYGYGPTGKVESIQGKYDKQYFYFNQSYDYKTMKFNKIKKKYKMLQGMHRENDVAQLHIQECILL